MAELTKEDLDKAIEEVKKRRPTREEIRAALACPICKKPAALIDDKCRFCGSYQDDDGRWITPKPAENQDREGTDNGKTWLDW